MIPDKLNDDAIVISGISGKFPNSKNINELIKNLMNGVDCVTENHSRWSEKYQQIPSRIGIISDITKLDNIFFGISSRLASSMDPVVRILLPCVWEAIADAGLNPFELRGKNIGVFASLSIVESDKIILYEKYEPHGFGMLGSARTMASNRISFFMDVVGPSCTIQSSCNGSAMALKKAIESIQSGECEAAIVDAGILVLFPNISSQLIQLGLLAPDGVNRSFDAKASGYTRSESVGVLFLQKAKDAKRIYAEISAINVLFGECIKEKTVMFNSAEFLAQTMRETLEQNGLKPSDITYIEADGTAIKRVDREELKAIDLVYAQDRNPSNPLLIGSVKSNIGHSSCTNTINSIIKVLIAMEKEVIPPNLHYDEPPEDAKCLRDGRVKVVTKPTPWTDGYAAVNTTSHGGSFSHIILKRHSKNMKKKKFPKNAMPRLSVMSVRTKEMLIEIFNDIKKNYEDEEFLQLIADLNERPLNNSLFRGYILTPPAGMTNPEKIVEEIEPITEQSKQIWFVFSGMGSQWTGMGESLMKIPIFAEAIRKCDAVLKPRGYDIVRILCDKDPTIYDNIINSFLGIAAVQIGLVDILYAVGIKPHYMIGHSVGELGCAYADGCFTAEEMILSALSRGLASIESNLIHGTMAAVGLGYEQVRHLCPEDVDVACHNSSDSSTISGPTESIKAFVKELQEKGIFAKIVPTSNIAYHSRYIAPAGPKLLKYLQEVISHPKARSERWISTSIPKSEWNLNKAHLSSAEYHTNNLLSPVLFEEVLTFIPKNAITIEISPHGLLQAILKKSMHSDCINLTLTKRGHKDNTTLLLSTLGKIYNLGYPIAIKELYPRISYPVSKNTPSISSLVQWEHSIDWFVCYYEECKTTSSTQKVFFLDLKSDKYKFLKDFRIGDDIIVPLPIYLHLVQEIQLLIGKQSDRFFIFENIIIYNKLLKVPENDILKLVIMVAKGSGQFEILFNDDTMVASGTITSKNMCIKEFPDTDFLKEENQIYTREDFYTDLFVRGYEYGEYYKCVNELSLNFSKGHLTWNKNWMPLLEGLFQVQIFSSNNKHILMPSMIRKIVIDTNEFVEETKEEKVLPMKYDKRINMIACTGIEMSGVEFTELTIKNTDFSSNSFVNEVRFIPYIDETEMNMIDVCHIVLGLLSENICENNTRKIIMIEESKSHDQDNTLECFQSILKTVNNTFEIKCIVKENLNQIFDEQFILIIIDSINFNDIKNILNNINEESFLLIIVKMENQDKLITAFTNIGLNLVLKKKIALDRTVLLLRKVKNAKKPIVIKNQNNCIDHLKRSLRDSKYDRVIFLVNTITDNNVFDTVRILKQEPEYRKLQVFDLQNSKAPKFSLENVFYRNQMKLNLYQNVLSSDNVWGTYRWMPLSEKSTFLPRWRANIEKSGSLTLMEELSLKEKDKSIVKVECAAFDLNIYEYWLNNEVNLDSQICITEYSGTDEKGHRVMGLLQNLTISNEICPDPDFTWTIPDSLSFEDAATMPQAYLAAFSILHKNSYYFTKIKTILIHIGASELGQALINLSLWYNFDVYTTYETEMEKQIIQSSQPRLPDSHIMNINYYKDFLFNITNDKGMDFVVASYSVLKDFESCLDVVGSHKTIVFIYDSKIINQMTFGTNAFLNDIRMYSYCLQDIMNLPTTMKRNIGELMRKALQENILKPLISYKLHLPKTTQEENKIVHQRYGKVLVSPLELSKSFDTVPSLCFDKDKCYFIVEGLDSFGMRLIKWLIDEGVTKLFVVSKETHKECKEYYLKKLCEHVERLELRMGIDLTNATVVQKLLREASSLGQLGIIFDLQRTNKEFLYSSFNSIRITQIFDQESKRLSPSLEKFIIFEFYDENEASSKVFVMEKVCEQRTTIGQNGLLVLIPNLFEITQSKFQPKAECYLRMLNLFQRLRVLIKMNSSIIFLYHKIVQKSIVIEDLSKEDMTEKEYEQRCFEEYLNVQQ
ncbi:fatty acid synthase-like [Vespa crabro]|uniref:fatty acid synthase-like n=1 Tax=Vespa crabro TaxID=7445 RepID=UPI001F00D12F|nr:fatty acid synthase-like [Vespa crabro]